VYLRTIHGGVGLADQRTAVRSARAEQRNADACANCDLPRVVKYIRRRQASANLLRYSLSLCEAADLRQHDHELIAAIAASRVTAADAERQARRHLLQDLVPRGMAACVVDALESVEVEQQHAHGFALAFGLQHRLPEPVEEQASIGQPGQGVVTRDVTRLRRFTLEPPHFAHEPRIAPGEACDRSSLRSHVGVHAHSHRLPGRHNESVRYRT
jgi:hypothetical protein